MDYLEIGCTPHDEPCAQVGQPDYAPQARVQCRALINQLERSFPCPCPDKAWLYVKSNPHDFGTYYEVAVKFDENDQQACDWAYLIEASLPERWDTEALKELAANGCPVPSF